MEMVAVGGIVFRPQHSPETLAGALVNDPQKLPFLR